MTVRRPFGRRALAVACLTAGAAIVVPPAPAWTATATSTSTSATPDTASSPNDVEGSIELLDQTDWVVPGQPFTMNLQVTTDLPVNQVELAVTVYNALPNRSSFQQSLNDRISGSSVILERRALTDTLQPDGSAQIVLPVQDPSQRRYYLRDDGVFPVRVELREAGTGEVISRLTTYLINEPAPPPASGRLGVATVLPISADPSTDRSKPMNAPDGGRDFGVIADVLTERPTLPVTLLPSPESMERLTGEQNKVDPDLAALVAARGDHPVVRTTWSGVPAALFGSELSSELARQLDRGTSVLKSQFGNLDTKDWIATEPLDANALEQLRSRQVEHLVARETDLAATNRDTTLARPFMTSTGKNRPTVLTLQADTGLTEHFNDAAGPVLAAHRLLADLAVIWNDRPGQQRSVVVMPPDGWNADRNFLQVFTRGLSNSPVVTATTLDQAFATPIESTGRTALLRQLAPLPKSASSLPVSRIVDSGRQLSGFSSLVRPDNTVLDELTRRLLLSEQADLTSKDRDEHLDVFKKTFDRQLSAIHMPSERSIRLTSRQGEIPVSIQNDTGYEIHVVLRLTSDKLEFPAGNTRAVTIERQHTTERFAVDARTSGGFPVQVRAESPDGSIALGRSRVTVRSTAASNVGLALSVGAGAFLVLWWMRSIVKSRRRNASASTGTSPAIIDAASSSGDTP